MKLKDKKLKVDLKWADFRLSPIKYFKQYGVKTLIISYKGRVFDNYILTVSITDVVEQKRKRGEKKKHRCCICEGKREVIYVTSPKFGFGYICRACRERYGIKRIVNKKLRKHR